MGRLTLREKPMVESWPLMSTVSRIDMVSPRIFCYLTKILGIPLILTGTPIRERSELESFVESTPGPQFATGGMTRDSSNKNSVTQLVAL